MSYLSNANLIFFLDNVNTCAMWRNEAQVCSYQHSPGINPAGKTVRRLIRDAPQITKQMNRGCATTVSNCTNILFVCVFFIRKEAEGDEEAEEAAPACRVRADGGCRRFSEVQGHAPHS